MSHNQGTDDSNSQRNPLAHSLPVSLSGNFRGQNKFRPPVRRVNRPNRGGMHKRTKTHAFNPRVLPPKAEHPGQGGQGRRGFYVPPRSSSLQGGETRQRQNSDPQKSKNDQSSSGGQRVVKQMPKRPPVKKPNRPAKYYKRVPGSGANFEGTSMRPPPNRPAKNFYNRRRGGGQGGTGQGANRFSGGGSRVFNSQGKKSGKVFKNVGVKESGDHGGATKQKESSMKNNQPPGPVGVAKRTAHNASSWNTSEVDNNGEKEITEEEILSRVGMEPSSAFLQKPPLPPSLPSKKPKFKDLYNKHKVAFSKDVVKKIKIGRESLKEDKRQRLDKMKRGEISTGENSFLAEVSKREQEKARKEEEEMKMIKMEKLKKEKAEQKLKSKKKGAGNKKNDGGKRPKIFDKAFFNMKERTFMDYVKETFFVLDHDGDAKVERHIVNDMAEFINHEKNDEILELVREEEVEKFDFEFFETLESEFFQLPYSSAELKALLEELTDGEGEENFDLEDFRTAIKEINKEEEIPLNEIDIDEILEGLAVNGVMQIDKICNEIGKK